MQELEELCIIHLPKTMAHALDPGLKKLPQAFFLETCQRWVWISHSAHFDSIVEKFSHFEGALVYRGLSAYLFLLRLATGLESEVVGETDIFGQIKMAWREVELARRPLYSDLGPWIRRVFEDTKEIRSRYLQNLGGGSYGTLVRKLLKNQKGLEGPLLFVGAGQIAQSIAPFLIESELWLTNRNLEHLASFHQSLAIRPRSRVKSILTHEEEAAAWAHAASVIICVPEDSELDPQRRAWFAQNTAGRSGRSIIHLGVMKEQSGEWASLPEFYCLSDLFALQSTLGNVRSVQIAQAEKACEERAKLRALGASLSVCHGREDLACFA